MSSLSPLFRHAPSPVEELHSFSFSNAGIRLLVKRDDLLRMGPGLALCGNKWRKLQYNLQAAREEGYDSLLTFGGAFSNHIAAVASAGQAFNFQTIGIIRGEQPAKLNPTLRFAEACGMRLEYLSRSVFRKKDSEDLQNQLRKKYGTFYLLPEGGTNMQALRGCRHIVEEVEAQTASLPDYWCCSLGTGGTFAGIVAALNGRGHALGFSALKGNFHQEEIKRLSGSKALSNWFINTGFHFGGYAKFSPLLIDFINGFYQQYGIALDPIYTGKMFYGIFQLIEEGFFPEGSSILAVHTGGLQGVAGFNERFGNLLEVGI